MPSTIRYIIAQTWWPTGPPTTSSLHPTTQTTQKLIPLPYRYKYFFLMKTSQNLLGFIQKSQSRRLQFLPINYLWIVKLAGLFTDLPGNLPEFIDYIFFNHQKQEYINILICIQFSLEDLEIYYTKKSPSVRKLFQYI